MKMFLSGSACSLALLCAASALAKPWVDYTPEKGFWQYTYVKVDVNYVDEYITRLKTIWVPGREIDEKHGLIDGYQVMVNINNGDSAANVMLCVHFKSFAGLDPDKQRDMEIQAENDAALPPQKADAAFTSFSKYRTIVGAAIYVPVDFSKQQP